MRIVAKSTLKAFWEKYPDSEKPLKIWYEKIKSGTWNNPNEIKMVFPDADQVGNGRIVFNIARNKYRLIVKFIYETQICYIRFIDTHKEYDKIKGIETI
ncbi:type II toxin-antitoxin system HigB family toxin [Flectobacillus sp. DC10W]|uniref:Type II toxin-antitoxin system HigB family toxin n=1 Tax=Flectobacillus longus TaxID=2984207 RepID=A0ABT6YVV5_9BACT|nr:type II toxin-antitoxin system HigB family toxin [Flectobacillus longus]MDI9867564.1 type II toxin-antitoxin system HigB family toxin [Flectobacillus longus]